MRNVNIAQKLGFSFLLTAIVPLIISAFMTYNNAKAAMTQQVMAGLLATSESTAYQIKNYFLERKRDATTLSHDPTIIDAAEKLNQAFLNGGLDAANYKAVDRQVRPFLTYFKDAAGFYDLFLISPAGDAFFSLNQGEDLGSNYKTGRYKDSELARVFDRASTLLETEISDFGYYQATNEPAAFVAAPLIKQGEVIGVVALQMSNQEVYRLVQEYAGLGQTGEIVIGSRVGDKVIFVTPVRNDPYAAFRRRIVMGLELDKPLQEAVQAKHGAGIAIDYREQKVLAAWRYLPSPRWGMVVKIDAAESFASIDCLRNLFVAIAVGALLVVTLVAGFISKSISDPIVKLREAAGALASGDLTHRAAIISSDEIGELADAFNKMAIRIDEDTEELKSANIALLTIQEELEQRVKTRTAELENANRELEAFAYSAAHDLRAPLCNIEGLSKLLIKGYGTALEIQGADYLQQVCSATLKMHQLIDGLLSLSKITRTNMHHDTVSLSHLVLELTEELQKGYPERTVEVIIAEEVYTRGDPNLLRIMLTNLLGNALKFSSKVPQPRIEFGLLRKEDETIFFISDNGVGFRMEHSDKIFAPFNRMHTEREFPGTGIGLATVQRIVNRHEGKIWVEAKEDHGATFFWTLPMPPPFLG
jgi:signal transduction histidine kinase